MLSVHQDKTERKDGTPSPNRRETVGVEEGHGDGAQNTTASDLVTDATVVPPPMAASIAVSMAPTAKTGSGAPPVENGQLSNNTQPGMYPYFTTNQVLRCCSALHE